MIPQELGTLPTRRVVSKAFLRERGFTIEDEDPRAGWEQDEDWRRQAKEAEEQKAAWLHHYLQEVAFEDLKRRETQQ